MGSRGGPDPTHNDALKWEEMATKWDPEIDHFWTDIVRKSVLGFHPPKYGGQKTCPDIHEIL